MNKIKILPQQEAQRIAAGEVVERPASPVKELIENSLDAGATQISLYIEHAGKQLIRVVDDGCGMSVDDAQLCFSNHATSKISSLADLESIHSFGFRGEALASIASVGKVTMTTKEPGASTGIQIQYENGVIVSKNTVACPVGTDIAVRELFYNTPVRKKFLKQDETEWNQIQSLFHAVALSNLLVHFKLFREGKLLINAPGVETLRSRVSQLWGHNFGEQMLPVKAEGLHGLISNHHFWRYGRQQMFFFVNNRWVKNAELSKSVMKGYRNVLPPARFPAVFLFIDIPQSMVDVNVHPRKEEVRFVKPVTIKTMIHKTITKTLEEQITKKLTTPMQPHVEPQILPSMIQPVVATENFESQATYPPIVEKKVVHMPYVSERQEAVPVTPTIRIIGQLLDTYILIENNDGLLLIDQHAAHERILYEKYLKIFEQKDGVHLLFPEIVRLNAQHLTTILSQKEFFARQGIELEQIGDTEIAIKSSPPKLQGEAIKEVIIQAIAFIESHGHLDEELFRKKLNEHVHSHLACKMAIKAGDKLSETQMHNVIEELMSVDNRFICVHGRPTMWTVGKLEIEKKFRRK